LQNSYEKPTLSILFLIFLQSAKMTTGMHFFRILNFFFLVFSCTSALKWDGGKIFASISRLNIGKAMVSFGTFTAATHLAVADVTTETVLSTPPVATTSSIVTPQLTAKAVLAEGIKPQTDLVNEIYSVVQRLPTYIDNKEYIEIRKAFRDYPAVELRKTCRTLIKFLDEDRKPAFEKEYKTMISEVDDVDRVRPYGTHYYVLNTLTNLFYFNE
jgi:hypothetical protein